MKIFYYGSKFKIIKKYNNIFFLGGGGGWGEVSGGGWSK